MKGERGVLTNDSVELGSFVAVVNSGTVLELPCAESSEVLFERWPSQG